MFEDLKPQSNSSKLKVQNSKFVAELSQDKIVIEGKERGNGQGGGAEDIFKDVENKNRPFLKGVEQSDEHGARKPKFKKPSNKRKFIFIGISIAIVLFIIFFFILLYVADNFDFNRIFSFGEEEESRTPPERSTGLEGIEGREEGEEGIEGIEGGEDEKSKIYPEPVERIENLKSKIIDTDGDGLADDDEERLGTSLYKVDTDGDGLSDREEIMVYKTDPLNPDTDGDGYLDGGEVAAGYNPKGEGKLYDF